MQPLGHGKAHAAHADPADLLRVASWPLPSSFAVARCPITGRGQAATACRADAARTQRATACDVAADAGLVRRDRQCTDARADARCRRELRTSRRAPARVDSRSVRGALRATRFRSSWSARCGRPWRISACFPPQLFPPLEASPRPSCGSRSTAFCRITPSTRSCACSPASRWRRCVGVALGIADGPLAPGRRHLAAAGQHRRADPGPRLCAAVPAVVRARQHSGRAAGRLRVGVSDHLQHLDRREGGQGNLGALGAGDGRRRPPPVPSRRSCRARCPTSSPACGSAWRRPGASWSASRCSRRCRGASAG